MSSAVDLQLVLDNRINVSADATKMVTISGVQNNFFELNPDGTGYSSNIIFQNVITPSLSNTLVSRNMRLRYTVQAVATANPPVLNPAGALGAGGAQCVLRCYPLQSVCQNISLVLNGATTTLNSQQVISALQRTIDPVYRKRQATEQPSMPDNTACLGADALGTALTSNQVMSSYYNSDGTTRASFFPTYWDNASHTVQWEVSENIMVSPLTIFDEENFLANINTLSLNFSFSNLNDMFVFSGAQAVPAGFTTTIVNPHLELTYIQVANDIVSIPRMVSYPYSNVVYFSKSMTPLAHTNVAQNFPTVQSDTLRFQSMPSLIYIFMRPAISSRTSAIGTGSQADAFFALGNQLVTTAGGQIQPNVSISCGNRTGLLTSASAKTLYRMSVRNGYKGTYADWQYGSGSLLILDPVQDLGINLQGGDILPGESGSVNFQFTGAFTSANFASATAAVGGADIAGLPVELMIVPVYSGIVSLTPDNCVFNIGELSEAEVNALLRTAPKDGTMISSEAVNPTIKGGDLWTRTKSILGSTAKGIGAVIDNPLFKQALGAAQGLGGALRRHR